MRKLLLSVTVVALLVVGVPGAGATNGVTAKEVELGITYPDLSVIRDITNIDHGDYEAAYQAVIDGINKEGGAGGRKIVPVFAGINPVGTVPAEEACLALTADEQVFAVTGFLNGDAPLCYLEQHDTPVLGGGMTAERLKRAKAPWFSLDAGDVRTAQVIDAMAADGTFKGKKVAVIAAQADEALMDSVALPALKRAGIKPVSVGVIDTPADDVVAAEQRAGVIAEKFEADGADVVLVVNTAVLTFLNALAKTDYRPEVAATSEEVLSGYIANKNAYNKEVLEGAITGGGVPASAAVEDPAIQQCITAYEKATGTSVTDPAEDAADPSADLPDTYVSPITACRNMALFTAIVDAAGKKLTNASFQKAGNALKSVDIPGIGTVTYDRKTRTFDTPVYLQRWDAAAENLVTDETPVAGTVSG